VLHTKPVEQAVLGPQLGTVSDDTAAFRLTFAETDDPDADADAT